MNVLCCDKTGTLTECTVRLSILVSKDDEHIIITKGALSNILEVCTMAETSQGIVDISSLGDKIQKEFIDLSGQGLRVLGLAARKIEARSALSETRLI